MMKLVILCFIPLSLGIYFASERVMAQECDKPCSNMTCSSPYFGTCCHKKNIAWGSQNTSQSSDYEDDNGRIFSSDLAVDGNTNTDFTYNTCTHTDDSDLKDAWWMIDMDSTYNISEIKLYLRDNNADRYNGLRVLVDSAECFRLNKTFSPGPTPLEDQIQHIHCSPPIPGSLVNVTINIGMLTLCEVQIFFCDPRWYGEECDRQCNCRDSTDCDKLTGWCKDGCRAGKQGQGCQCDCSNGSYGFDCRESCGHCSGGTVCDKTNGTCHSGCVQGFKPPLCQECEESYHESGDGCEKCGLCEDNKSCNITSGKCPGNCQAGYKQPFCKQECDEGKFGINCLQTCGKCSGDQSCNKTDGTCQDGCLENFVEPMCTECDDGKFGIRCNSSCGKCYGDQSCNKTDGTCQDGCQEDFVGPLCTDCVPGKYGTHCKSICGQCAENVTCIRDGSCPHGCLPGFTDGLCQTLVEDDMAPMAGGVSTVILIVIFIIVIVIVIMRRRRTQKESKTTGASRDENQKDTSFINISDPSVKKQATQQPTHTTNVKDPSKRQEATNKRKPCLLATRSEEKREKHAAETPANQEPEDLPADKIPEVHPTEPPSGGNEYYSVIPAAIPLPTLPQYIKERMNSVGFDNEFELLPYGIHDDHDEGRKPENKKRNRFLELYPYDHSRVILKPEVDDDSDYINASYINGYRSTNTFIAAQGPNPVTVDDFWHMIWQENVSTIVMVTRLKELTKKKCEQYWPDDKEIREFGNIRVHHEYSTVRRDYTIRTFKVNHSVHESESREITQLQFTSWPDHDVPSAPALVCFWKQFRRLHQEQDTGPVLVHCSAGVGRTGTFIALDWLFDEAEREKKVNVFNCVNQMRKARMNMVQTVSQYRFLHEVVLEAVQSKNTFYTSTEFLLKFGTGESFTDDQESEIQRQFKKLNEMRKILTDKQVSDAKLHENIDKNRDQNILPENKSKPYLMTRVKGRTQYINAVVLPLYACPLAVIATQTPLPDTVVDFWRLVYDHDIVNIICLEDFEIIYPSKDSPVEIGKFQICLDKQQIRRNSFTQTQMTLTFMEEDEENRQITVYRPSCASPSDLLEFVNEMETRGVFGQGQLLVHCNNGSDLCGLFCGVLNIITRLRLDRQVDIFLDIRELQAIRPSFIHSLDQYRFCFDAVKEYERSTSIYANI